LKNYLSVVLGYLISAVLAASTLAVSATERLFQTLRAMSVALVNSQLRAYYYLWASRTLSAVGASVPSYHSGISVGSVILVVVAAIALSLGIFLVGTFQVTLDTSGLSTAAISAIGTVYSNTYSALQLLGVGLIVLAVVSILGLLINAFASKKGGGA